MRMNQILFLPIIFASFFTPPLVQDNTPTTTLGDSKEVMGSYWFNTGFVGASYTIYGDYKYKYLTYSDCCDPVWQESGSYELRDNLLHLKISKQTLNEYNMLDPNQATAAYRKLYGRMTEVQASEITTEHDMQVVRWGGRIYLFDPKEINLFAAAVNFGTEPRTGIIRGEHFGEFFLRDGDEHKTVTGKPALPERWLPYLHESPIRANVTKMEVQDQKEAYQLDKGYAEGVRVEMVFIKEGARRDYFEILLVTSVKEHSATAKGRGPFPNFQVGDSFVTRISREPR